MSWLYLLIAGVFEICFAVSLKYSAGFTKPLPSVLFIIFTILSYLFLDKSLETIPLGTAYAIWTGIGATGIAFIGIFYLGEPTGFWRIFFIFTLISSIIGLKFVSN